VIGKVFEGSGPNNLYFPVVSEIKENGKPVTSRNLKTKEIRPVMMVLGKPQERFLTCPGRKINSPFQVMESLWILGGRGDVSWISYYLKNIEQFSDGKPEFNAPYGIRMRYYNQHRSVEFVSPYVDQFRNSFEYLNKDPETRHALMSFWNPNFDNRKNVTIDRPCNVTQHFLIRDGKLDLSIFCRSNDVHLGLFNANVVQFSVILEAMAMLLGISVGIQTHFIDSLHYYLDDPITERIFDKAKRAFNAYDHVTPLPFEMSFSEDKSRINSFYSELDDFFIIEKRIRNGNISEETNFFTFNFLNDAAALAKSFYYYKRKNYYLAMDYLSDIKADDIYISALEFIVRKTSEKEIDFVRELLRDRFAFLGEESLIEIENFTLLH